MLRAVENIRTFLSVEVNKQIRVYGIVIYVDDSNKILTDRIDFLTKQVDETDLFKIVFEQAFNHIIITDIDGKIIFANTSSERITGFSKEEMIGKRPSLWGNLMGKIFYKKLWTTIKEDKKPFHGEVKNHRKNGDIYFAILTITPFFNKQSQLQGFIGIEEDITRLKELDRMKDDFLSMASHELRTPLTAIKWFTERLSAQEHDQNQLSIINKIEVVTQKVIDLVNTLLNISRIESGRLMINSVVSDLSQLVNDSVEETKLKYKNKNQNITLTMEPNLPKVKTDPELVTEIMINLLTNAMKYSPDNTEIDVKLYMAGGQKHIIFEVIDHGYGIPESEQKKMFNRFFRAENITSKVVEGTGLGLYLSNIIAKAIMAQLNFTSVEHQGSVFRLAIPVAGTVEKRGEISLQKL